MGRRRGAEMIRTSGDDINVQRGYRIGLLTTIVLLVNASTAQLRNATRAEDLIAHAVFAGIRASRLSVALHPICLGLPGARRDLFTCRGARLRVVLGLCPGLHRCWSRRGGGGSPQRLAPSSQATTIAHQWQVGEPWPREHQVHKQPRPRWRSRCAIGSQALRRRMAGPPRLALPPVVPPQYLCSTFAVLCDQAGVHCGIFPASTVRISAAGMHRHRHDPVIHGSYIVRSLGQVGLRAARLRFPFRSGAAAGDCRWGHLCLHGALRSV